MQNPSIDYDGYQFFDIPNDTGTPERRLILGILERGILDLVGNDAKEALEAEFWLFEDESDEEDQFSFRWVCGQLDLDFPLVRQKIKAMPKRGESRLAPWYMKKAS